MKALNQNLELVIVELESKLKALESDYEVALERANTDELTRLLRRRAFMEKFDNLLTCSKQDGKEVHLLMVDIDHFKKVNDNYGHQTGDAVLERVSELIKQYLRPSDLAGRYGGEEIIIAMQASASQAQWIAQCIRKMIEDSKMISVESKVEFQVTLSLGSASSQKFGYEARTLIARADEALYVAKKSGRNRIVEADVKTAEVAVVESVVAA